MSDAPAAAPVEEQLQNLHLDEVTGERVSKTELKKRQKQRDKEDKKKEKAAIAGPKPAASKKTSAEEEEAHLNPNVRRTTRTEDLFADQSHSNTLRFDLGRSISYERARNTTLIRTSFRSPPTYGNSSRSMNRSRQESIARMSRYGSAVESTRSVCLARNWSSTTFVPKASRSR